MPQETSINRAMITVANRERELMLNRFAQIIIDLTSTRARNVGYPVEAGPLTRILETLVRDFGNSSQIPFDRFAFGDDDDDDLGGGNEDEMTSEDEDDEVGIEEIQIQQI